jgi:hypothetical protein
MAIEMNAVVEEQRAEKLSGTCPFCGGDTRLTRVSCTTCGVNIEGELEVPRLARLSPGSRKLLEAYLLSNGSLKELGERVGLSYRPLRSRLDKVAQELKREREQDEARRLELLDMVANGTLSAEAAAARIEELDLSPYGGE